jgi:hypothetical protein
MNRRSFLKTTAGVAGTGILGGVIAPSETGETLARKVNPSPAAAHYSVAEHRRRLENIDRCRKAIRTCLRRVLVTDYLPAQCCYNLGEYPATKPWSLAAYDEQELDRLRDHGIQVIQWFDDWADPLRLFGGDKYTPASTANVRRFIERAHQRGMKVLPYASSCFLQRTDPDFRPEWSREGDNLVLGYWNMARCSPASPGWRAYLLPRIARILDDYGADGIYIDGGYVANQYRQLRPPARDEMAAFEETAELDGAFGDLLALIYGEVKRRGGILKLHVNGADAPHVGGLKVYDYLWVGEGVGNADRLRQAVKNYPPYVVPCIDQAFAQVASEDEPFLHAIPYLQFPILHAGKPVTGQRGAIPGVRYAPEAGDFWMKRCREIRLRHQAHPAGPHTYSIWDAFPGRPEARPTHARWLARYRPLVEEGTWAWLEVGGSDLLPEKLPSDVVASAFANRELYLVLANYGQQAVQITTTDAYVSTDAPSAPPAKQWRIGQHSLMILRRST